MVLPELPRVFIDTTYAPPSGLIPVPSGSDFQAALNKAQMGDVIQLEAGGTWTGSFILPAKTGPGWIYIQSSALGSLPTPGTRVKPSHAPYMPKVETIETAPGAHHYRFVGIEFRPPAGAQVGTTVLLGTGIEASLSALPHDITIDRCYIHGDSTPTQEVRHGIFLGAAAAAVIDSYISGIRSTTNDAQAIVCTNSPGPLKIVNNYLEGTGENLMFGGWDPSIQSLVPSDIEIRGNYFAKPLSWRIGDPSYAGVPWRIKNLLELKNARRALIDGNVLEYNWVQADQHGFAVVFTPRNQNGGAPWSAVQDVTFTHNIIRHSTAGINLLGWDNNYPSQQLQRVLIQHNLLFDIGAFGSPGRLFQLVDGTATVVIDHNSGFQSDNPLVAGIIIPSRAAHTGLIFTNNLAPNGPYGVGGDNTFGDPLRTLATYFPGALFVRNVLLDGVAANYPPGNFFPSIHTPVVNAAYGGDDYHLVPGSPYAKAGTDGKDIGADIDALLAATATAVSGVAGSPPPPPPPPPPPTPKVWTGTVTATQEAPGRLRITGILTGGP